MIIGSLTTTFRMIDSPDSVPLAYLNVLQLIDTVYLLYSRTYVNLS